MKKFGIIAMVLLVVIIGLSVTGCGQKESYVRQSGLFEISGYSFKDAKSVLPFDVFKNIDIQERINHQRYFSIFQKNCGYGELITYKKADIVVIVLEEYNCNLPRGKFSAIDAEGKLLKVVEIHGLLGCYSKIWQKGYNLYYIYNMPRDRIVEFKYRVDPEITKSKGIPTAIPCFSASYHGEQTLVIFCGMGIGKSSVR